MQTLHIHVSTAYLSWMTVMLYVVLAPSFVHSQIPTACADAESLRTLTCCPNECGEADGRGVCEDIDLPDHYSRTSSDVRANWPHYFTRACRCTGNYWGYDCTRCKYGYYGEDCSQQQTLPFRSIQQLTYEEWRDYIDIIKMTRTYPSEYKAVLNESPPGTTDLRTTDIDLYYLFIWVHFHASKDLSCKEGDPCTKVIYAHEGSGFPTWHRQYMLWFEWEIQHMLKSMGRSDYHTFRFPYWDWRREIQMENDNFFVEDKLGESRPNDEGQPQVYGDLFSDGWDTICWYGGSGNVMEEPGTICNPNNKTGPLLRCPTLPGYEPCSRDNPEWPNLEDVNNAIAKPVYDTPNYNMFTSIDSFRNYMEGINRHISIEECRTSANCICTVGDPNCEGENAGSPLQLCLHNVVHNMIGGGDERHNIPRHQHGVMVNPAASPNDPLFLNHHSMVDCILEEWIQRHPDAEYPDDVPDELRGMRRDDYIVPFFPLVTHGEFLKTADNFGHSCRLPNIR